MILGDTPTVVQRSPVSSWLPISTRVTASVPASSVERTRWAHPSFYPAASRQTLVDLGDTERGVEYLLRAYLLDGEDVFERDGRPYLKFLRDRNLIN